MDDVSKILKMHYEEKFEANGPTSQGVDWGDDSSRLNMRYEKMLAVTHGDLTGSYSVLDVGCGFGGFLEYMQLKDLKPAYTGIDVSENMIDWAKKHQVDQEFICGDVLDYDFRRQFDYIICNGILTQKLSVPGLTMDQFAQRLIRRMFELCVKGVVFNVMTTKVNFFSNNLYYRNPAELFSWCLSEITPHVKIDHSYPLYEFALYLYRTPDRASGYHKDLAGRSL